MKIVCISDLHGETPELPDGDLLIIAGDITARDKIPEWKRFYDWLKTLQFKKIIYIAGNHDGFLEGCLNNTQAKEFYESTGFDPDCKPSDHIVYLCDSGTEFEGLKIWGSPWTPEFCDWHFMKKRAALKAVWDLVPDDTDILVTHGPPLRVMDTVNPFCSAFERLGDYHLLQAMERVKPKLHVFGHIHGGYGQLVYKHQGPNTICVNAAHMDEQYKPVNKPIVVEL